MHTDIVHHTPTVTAFLGAHQWPNNHGNVIVMPNEHFENIYDLPTHFALPLHELIKAIALALKTVYACEGISTRQHNEPAGNQDVWHYHVHVTPRYHDDGFYGGYTSQRTLMPPSERAKHAHKLRAYLAGQR
jgi:histidine triad (HIT) family protein